MHLSTKVQETEREQFNKSMWLSYWEATLDSGALMSMPDINLQFDCCHVEPQILTQVNPNVSNV